MRRSFALIRRRHDASDDACVDLPDEGGPRDETLKMDNRGKATARPPPRRHGPGQHGHSMGGKSAVTPSPPAGHRAIPSAAAKEIPPPLCARRDGRHHSPSDHHEQLHRHRAQQHRAEPLPPPRLHRQAKLQGQGDPAKKFEHKHSQMTAKEAYQMVLLLSEEKLSERRPHSSLGSAMQDGLHEGSGRVEMSAAEIEADGQPSRRRIRDGFPKASIAARPRPQKRRHRHGGFRDDYQLGETLRRPSHAVRRPNPEAALPAVESMSRGDFAFVLRSDGSHTYSMLAHRSESPRLEQRLDSIQIRRETAQLEMYQETQADPEEYEAEDDWAPPCMITFDRDEAQDNGCSVISSVFERARFFNRQQRQIRRKRRELQQ